MRWFREACNIAGTNLIEGHELVFAQLQADHPGEKIDYIHCERRENFFDVFSRITFTDFGHREHGLLTNDVIDHLGADGMYRRFEGEVEHPQKESR
ncbi:hypothetical protein [Saccharopolyspora elongata]|uniref:Uncharacterized protein n=1 Tax=Saccharopolyspora elongata TaxID=2530387 RepID=A0A4R4YHV3_9PSEU|nr:hypothetical protein [Saccharopolyspora elongata]TDD42892.1 hypothetical protein E1288_27850 [Saccharopolyspora elongata]